MKKLIEFVSRVADKITAGQGLQLKDKDFSLKKYFWSDIFPLYDEYLGYYTLDDVLSLEKQLRDNYGELLPQVYIAAIGMALDNIRAPKDVVNAFSERYDIPIMVVEKKKTDIPNGDVDSLPF